MSKKKKTQHQNFKYHVALLDSYDFESTSDKVSDVFDTEQEAIDAAKAYAMENSIEVNRKSFLKILIVNSDGNSYQL
ncbi:DUF2188 domain-containing protein [Brumicola pallidula]|uniref:Uncharacterized protein n=1 Tax=Brumicola pallidula DSM 14239 = ACAM 615 TaxID=1121922 RepID=K6Z2H0_9ALTE|nr:DUF2188 domain-containing protein [Glaciecola pallidula]GAC30391.1 hypothetical protein GPAL_3545 [Glaciecola pallidula DSM 14239 = ACAM 615]